LFVKIDFFTEKIPVTIWFLPPIFAVWKKNFAIWQYIGQKYVIKAQKLLDKRPKRASNKDRKSFTKISRFFIVGLNKNGYILKVSKKTNNKIRTEEELLLGRRKYL
jgi:hypothetical protein